MSRAAEVDSAYRRTNSLFSKGIQSKGRSSWKPRLQRYGEYRGEPMDIGYVGQSDRAPGPSKGPRMTRNEGNQKKEDRPCFNCGKTGHWAQECRAPKKNAQPSTGERQSQKRTAFPKKQEQKKKFNPSQMRQHIRALIDENFDEGSEEYAAFVEEVEEKGF
jgi:hypothetical protein